LEDKHGNKIGHALNAENLAIKESEIKAKTEKQKFSFAVKE
jgi:hypothetical protein